VDAFRPNRWKGLVLGTIGGIAGTIAMGYYWQAATALVGQDPRQETSDEPGALDSISLVGKQHRDDESSTAALGRIGYRALAGAEPDGETKTTLSYLVHYGYGALTGGLYGALRGAGPLLDLRGGAFFGIGLWLFGDELGVSLLGLAEGPTTYPPGQHAHRFGAHVAYGLGVAATTRLLHRLV